MKFNFEIRAPLKTKLQTAFLVITLIFFSTKNSTACTIAFDPDSTKTKYELNDPRNPDCPCHAAQKLADEEYRKLQEQNAINDVQDNADNQADVNKNTDHSGTSSSIGTKHYSKSYRALKHMNKLMKKMKRQMGKKNNGTKKGKRRLVNCFHFN